MAEKEHLFVCACFFDSVYLKVCGEQLAFEVINIYEWLWEHLQGGKHGGYVEGAAQEVSEVYA